MEYGKPVAVLIDGAIRFGVITEIATKINAAGEKTTYRVEFDPEHRALPPYVIVQEDQLKAVHSWHTYEAAEALARAAKLLDWCERRSEQILAPAPKEAVEKMIDDQIKLQEPVKHQPHHHPVPGEDAELVKDIPF